ncbi:hypothetical protein AAFF_G00056830 [Aldrovandia affinis]|uniref:Uncharacterized protein n=1 Tax=Aldrovandia affinis TaxID=143900 RepID=A0AAD7S0Q7_9TELE|nr:hypothetical protein AAFF_G00056830 [Aldrovandia affinis]
MPLFRLSRFGISLCNGPPPPERNTPTTGGRSGSPSARCSQGEKGVDVGPRSPLTEPLPAQFNLPQMWRTITQLNTAKLPGGPRH